MGRWLMKYSCADWATVILTAEQEAIVLKNTPPYLEAVPCRYKFGVECWARCFSSVRWASGICPKARPAEAWGERSFARAGTMACPAAVVRPKDASPETWAAWVDTAPSGTVCHA